MNECYDVYESIELLKEKITLVDDKNNIFYLRNKVIRVKGKNSSYSLQKDDYLKLYEKAKFYIYDDKEVVIDSLKDEEYYKDFKHK